MSIILTSFQRSPRYFGDKFAICDRQPEAYNYTELLFFAPADRNGKTIRSADFFKRKKEEAFDAHDFYDAVDKYRQELLAGYCNNLDEIKYWLAELTLEQNIVLCCWCPHSKASQEQIKDLGVMACHCGIVAEVITLCRPDLTVILDIDRSDKLVPQWQFGQMEQMNLYPSPPLPYPTRLEK